MRAVGYIRVSTEEQSRDGISIAHQTDSITSFCQAKSWDLLEIIRDDKTGKDMKRPGIQKLIAMIQAKKLDVAVIYKLDRLTRSVRDLGYLVADVFDKNGVAVSSIQDSFDTSNASGKLILNVLGSIAQWERETIAERTRDGLRYKKSKLQCYGPVPYGFDRDGDRLIPDHGEMQIVNMIKRLRHKLRYSYRKICDRLNEERIVTRLGRNWTPGSIQIIANNTVYDHVKSLA